MLLTMLILVIVACSGETSKKNKDVVITVRPTQTVALQITVPTNTPTEAPLPTQTASLQGVTAPANTPIEMPSLVVVPANLCREAEQIVFSCQIKGSDKILSVCAAQNLDRENGYLQYRFGTNKEVELEFPGDIRDSQKAFQYSRYTRPLVTYLRLSFQENNYTFTVYDNIPNIFRIDNFDVEDFTCDGHGNHIP